MSIVSKEPMADDRRTKIITPETLKMPHLREDYALYTPKASCFARPVCIKRYISLGSKAARRIYWTPRRVAWSVHATYG